jgi:hypothetical protein
MGHLIMAMTSDTSDGGKTGKSGHWRSRAADLRAMAADYPDREIQCALLEIAENYEQLARLAELREP